MDAIAPRAHCDHPNALEQIHRWRIDVKYVGTHFDGFGVHILGLHW